MSNEIILDDWQKEVLAYNGDILLCTGRRVGKTYILARKAIDDMIKNKGMPVVIISLTEDQAMIILAMALNYAKEVCPKLIGKGKNKPTMRTLYINTGKMTVRPAGNTGDGARGFEGGRLIVDEASRMPKLFWIASLPTILTTNGQVWLGSTPYGKKGYFWERFNEAYYKKEPNARYKVFYISTEEVMKNRKISKAWTEEQSKGALRVLAEDKKTMSPLEYGQEYLGLFLEELQCFFEDEWIEKVCILDKNPSMVGERFLGVDIGRMYDPSAFEDVCKVRDKYYHVDSQTTTRTKTNETQDKIIEMDKAVNYVEIGIDAGSGSLGVGIYDNLMTTNIKRKLKAMNNRAIALEKNNKAKQRLMKEDYYHNMLAMGINGELKLLNDEAVKRSLRSVQWEIINEDSGTSRIRIFGNDTHITEGLIRACWLAKKKKVINISIKYI
jgi:hypothetical protein